jgi:hypothetical protein
MLDTKSYRELQKIVRESGLPIKTRVSQKVLLQAIRDYKKPIFVESHINTLSYTELLKIKRENKIKSPSKKKPDVIKSILEWGKHTFDFTPNEQLPEKQYKLKEFEITVKDKLKDLKYPYFVRIKAILPGKTIINQSGKYTLINNDQERRQYVTAITNVVFNYDTLQELDLVNNVSIEAYADVFYPNTGNTDIIRVANSPDENCLLKIIRTLHPVKLTKIYKKYPSLETQKYVSQDQIQAVAKAARLRIRIYTPLGSQTDQVWREFGYTNDKVLAVIVSNEHATMKTSLSTISKVRYVESVEKDESINVIHTEWDYILLRGEVIGAEVYYRILLENNELVIEKTLKPSQITNDLNDDIDPMYFRCYKPEQVLYKRFAKGNIHSIRDDVINKIIIQSEHFISRRMMKPVPKNATELDHNRNFSAYETLKEYIGFPETTLFPCKTPDSPAFVIIHDIIDPPEYLRELYQYKSGTIVLPFPVYQYILPDCKDIQVDFYLNAKFRHISIYDFARQFDIKYEKAFVNSAIGRTISGGIDAKRHVQFEVKNENEVQQIIDECYALNLEFSYVKHRFSVYIPERPRGDFCFHSYILGYASIHLFTKYKQHNVIGYNVDALLVEGKFTEHSTEIGGWKSGPVKNFYKMMSVAPITQKPTILPDIQVSTQSLRKNILVVGPAGVGKTHKYITGNYHGMIFAAPRCVLRDDKKPQFPNSHTGQKLFQPSRDDQTFYSHIIRKVPRNYQILVLDEVGMYTRTEHETIRRRTPDGVVCVYLYDPNQIHNELTNDPVDIDYFISMGFEVEYITRTPDTVARHSYDYGCRLDKIPGGYLDFKHADTTPSHTDRIVTGNHKRAKVLNDRYRSQFALFPVRDRKNRPHYVSPDDPRIFWDKKEMNDSIPKGYKYLPALAITPDSIQGITISTYTLFVDYKYLKRHGCLYVAMTRTTEEKLTLLYDD